MARAKGNGPRHGSRAYRALVALYQCGSMNLSDWMAMSSYQQARFEFNRDVAQQLVHWKLATLVGTEYRILDGGLRFLGVLPEIVVTSAPAAARYVPPKRALSAQHRPAMRVIRSGAFDYQAIPSRVGDQVIPHGEKAVA